MLKEILVVLEDSSDKAATAYAVSFAQRVGARLAALWPGRDASVTTDGSLEARYEYARGDRSERAVRAERLLDDLGAQAKAAGVEAEIIDFDGPGHVQPRDVPTFARAFDLVLIQQPEAGRAPGLNDLAGAVLAESGRPVLVVPGIQTAPARFERIVAAWDGSAGAARAIGDAAPLLERAAHVDLVAINSAGVSPFVVAGAERFVRRLARAGVDAQYRHIPGEGEPADFLLSYAADASGDMIVAGGYGHSRLREAILGGVTRTLLGSMTIPVFMSH